MALDFKTLPIEQKQLHTPPLNEVAAVLSDGLKKHFKEVKVEVTECPDLTQQPFTLANKGLNGNAHLVEVGGPPYLAPLVQRDKIYNLCDVAKLQNINPAFVIGAGAGPHVYAGTNCEGIMNMSVQDDVVDQHSRIVKINGTDGNPIQQRLDNTETRFALLGNFFVSEGKPGLVLKVSAKHRIGSDDFIASIRTVLADHYGDKIIGVGGTFLLKEGKAKQHVMPDFSTTPITSDEDINNWLRFFDMSAPLIATGTLVTGDHDLDLRLQHFHSFSHHGEGGHYHIDTTPETVEYLGYFNLGENIYRVDRPVDTHQIGRD
ncbi:hypothetical protein FQR65_LT07409 [Abscondita terminalis]|nr:hypothetical protein FQR65_LT07409 [Abscondita terminalis]